MATSIRRKVQAPTPLDYNFKALQGDDAEVVLVNLTNNIIELPMKDKKGGYVVLGAAVDAGLIGAKQPEVTVTVGEIRRARMNPAFELMFTGNRPALDIRGQRPTILMGVYDDDTTSD